MPNRKAKHDIAPTLRGAFLKGLKQYCDKRKITLAEAMAEWIEEDWEAVLKVMGKYAVQEKNTTVKATGTVKHEHTHVALSEIDGWLEGFGAQKKDSNTKKALPN